MSEQIVNVKLSVAIVVRRVYSNRPSRQITQRYGREKAVRDDGLGVWRGNIHHYV